MVSTVIDFASPHLQLIGKMRESPLSLSPWPTFYPFPSKTTSKLLHLFYSIFSIQFFKNPFKTSTWPIVFCSLHSGTVIEERTGIRKGTVELPGTLLECPCNGGNTLCCRLVTITANLKCMPEKGPPFSLPVEESFSNRCG